MLPESFGVGFDSLSLVSGMEKTDEGTLDEHTRTQETDRGSLVHHRRRLLYWLHLSALSCKTS
jgi:hypothetical protein